MYVIIGTISQHRNVPFTSRSVAVEERELDFISFHQILLMLVSHDLLFSNFEIILMTCRE
jgi:hypothetical protein